MLEFQQCAAPASRFNRPAMPVGHPKVRAFYAIAASVAGMGGNGRIAQCPQRRFNVARVSVGAPGELMAPQACTGAAISFPGCAALTRAT